MLLCVLLLGGATSICGEVTCPVHALGPFVQSVQAGDELFLGITPAIALGLLRNILGELEVKDAHSFRTHDFRRGHALDLQNSGASLIQILRAGEWRSPAFLDYLDMHSLERDAVVQAHVDDSASEDEC